MPWEEFSDLISGLSGETALANIVRIRTTTDKETLKQLTPEQRRERAAWQRRQAMRRSKSDNASMLATLQQALANAFGGGNHAE